jgi:hypothetical protein
VRGARNAVLIIAGSWLILESLLSAIRSTILPRGVRQRLSRLVFLSLRVVFRLAAGRSPSYERRDRIMAMYGPMALLSLLSTWYVMVVAGYTAIYLAVGIKPLGAAFRLSGSALVTLGTTSSPKLWPSILTYTEAGLGLLLLTLLITYLPTIYAAYSQRETAVTALEVRAGNPPHATTLLIRFQRVGMTTRLSEFWQQWEGWFSTLEETHTAFSVLPFFRSPQPDKSWVTAAGTVLDAASLWASTIEHPNDPDAQLCIRAGFVALRRVADFFNLPHDPSPDPADPITISREEFDAACRQMAEAGLPVTADRDAAWAGYAGWRVNYDAVLLNLARMVEAPIAPWTSDRSPVTAWTLRGSFIRRPTMRGRRWRRRARQA